MTQELDLTPDPRILQMLGEIDLHQWRCIAELIDNGIDGLMQAARSGSPIDTPEITVNIPTSNKGDARVSVKDNGPGMSIDVLEKAVKAGWTSNNNPPRSTALAFSGWVSTLQRRGWAWSPKSGRRERVIRSGTASELTWMRCAPAKASRSRGKHAPNPTMRIMELTCPQFEGHF